MTRTTRLAYRWNFLNQLLFYPSILRAIARGESRYVQWSWRARRSWFWSFARGMALVLTLYAAMVWVDWRCFFLYGLLPHAYAAWGIMGINYGQHDGCDPDSPVNHSRNFVGRWLNFVAFNNGYHGVHHIAPSLHWSLLPAAHAVVLRPHVHPGLEQTSLIAWLWRSLIWPGERRTFEGKVFVPPAPVADVDWLGDDEARAEDHPSHGIEAAR